MSNPKFRPRDCARSPRLFGRLPKIQWVDPGVHPADQIAAAKFQHTLVVTVGAQVRMRDGWSLVRLAGELGWSRDRLGRLMRGELTMRLEDAASMARFTNGRLSVEQGVAE